jgi:hypothetical protein
MNAKEEVAELGEFLKELEKGQKEVDKLEDKAEAEVK